MTVPTDTSWPFLTAIEITVPAAVEGTSMDAFSLSSVMQRIVHADSAPDRDQHLDDGGSFGVAEVGNPNFDLAHNSAFTSPSV